MENGRNFVNLIHLALMRQVKRSCELDNKLRACPEVYCTMELVTFVAPGIGAS